MSSSSSSPYTPPGNSNNNGYVSPSSSAPLRSPDDITYSAKVKRVLKHGHKKDKTPENKKKFENLSGQTLFTVISNDDKETFDLFLDSYNANPDGSGSIISPLYVAVDMENEYYVRRLLEKGASVIRKNNDEEKDFPLRLALSKGPSPINDLFFSHLVKLEIASKGMPNAYKPNNLNLEETPINPNNPKKRKKLNTE
eukprot:TRINITY_DN321_c0_g1_i1.p1 TRINITY_DN321_c0_g1~~TRINITY_DN321_c0_g1_i1.p1  ORF type:complete len:197 (-),score=79.23 TRINITY_DN321_c0_g1_i1:150-740(-)